MSELSHTLRTKRQEGVDPRPVALDLGVGTVFAGSGRRSGDPVARRNWKNRHAAD